MKIPQAFLAAHKYMLDVPDTQVPVLLGAATPVLLASDPYTNAGHPFWQFEWDLASAPEVMGCSVALVFAGLLCSAGGIGGGGIYVTVLMVAGGLSPKDAVPLSKAIVFFGSLSSLVLNLRRHFAEKEGPGKPLIDLTILHIVVPAALAGTLLGVLLNRTTSDTAIIVVLSLLLVGITLTVTRTAYQQYMEEASLASDGAVSTESATSSADDRQDTAADPMEGSSVLDRDEALTEKAAPAGQALARAQTSKPNVQNEGAQLKDSFLLCAMLVVVVACGVVRFHAGTCWEEIQTHGFASWHASCHHPAVFLVGDRLEHWMKSTVSAGCVMVLLLVLPTAVCLVVMAKGAVTCVQKEGWQWQEVALYEAMGMVTGCLAGLVGIGGGLIFSPFFLIMGIDPSIAVATSSTCVIFTSSSTTLQYLLTDRVIMSLTLVYGLVNLVASWGGTAFVHLLTDKFVGRRSYVTAIVALGVLVSAVLSLTKIRV